MKIKKKNKIKKKIIITPMNTKIKKIQNLNNMINKNKMKKKKNNKIIKMHIII